MTFFSLKLNASDIAQLMQLNEKIQKIPKGSPEDLGYKFMREEEINRDNTCSHCPKYLLLTEEVNKVVEKMANDPKLSISDELPIKLNKLKFLYYTEAIHNKNGSIECQRFLDHTPDLRPTKFDGQFKLIAADALKYKAVTDIQYINPDLDEVVYYYRGEGDQKDIVVQAIFTKNGGRFRYFKYTPTEEEKNPNHLPDFDNLHEPNFALKPANTTPLKLQDDDIEKPATSSETSAPSSSPKDPNNFVNYDIRYDEKYNHTPIPKNIHFMQAKMVQEIAGLKVHGTSDASLKGNEAKLALKTDTADLVIVDVNIKPSGKTEHTIQIPYSIRVVDSLPKVQGSIQTGSSGDVVTFVLADKDVEYLHSEYRKNSATNRDSYVLSRNIAVDPKETVSMQYVRGEDGKRYASVKDTRNLGNNALLVVGVQWGVGSEAKTATISYQRQF